jgi:uncharacterized protein
MTEGEIYKLHQKYAHGKFKEKTLEICWNHSQIILSIAIQLAERLNNNFEIKANMDLLKEGALIHDIGFYDCFDDDYNKQEPYIRHIQIGYEIAMKETGAMPLARFCMSHSGISLEQINAKNFPLEKHDYLPVTLEEELVNFADKFHSKSHPCFDAYEIEIKKIEEYEPAAAFRLETLRKKFGLPDLEKLNQKYSPWHREINAWVNSIRQ